VLLVILSVSTSLFAEKGFYLLGTMTGQGINDCYYHVAGIGDVNGDGFDDAMVGASAGQYAHLFLGSADFDTIPDVIFKNMYVGTICGDDWNCDGYSDIAIGDPIFSLGNREILESGKVWIYFGGPQIDTIPDLELVVGDVEEFTGWYYRFGSSITGGGDVNGDGYHDLIVGAPYDDYDAHGRVYIYFGGLQIDNQYDVLLEGEGHFDMFGTSIDIAGDINQDGCDDLIIGAPQDLKQEDGQAYLVYGGEQISLDNSVLFEGDSAKVFGSFGRVVSGLGDINADGLSDFAIMACKYLRIFSGNNLKIASEIILEKNWGSFYSVIGEFDINNDNICDIAVSTQEAFNDQCYNKLQLYKGGLEIDTLPYYEVVMLAYGYLFNISYAGYINNDNDKDIIIGDTYDGRGRAYIYSYGEINFIDEEKRTSINNYFHINQNYPNPFNAETRLSYYIPNDGDVGVNIYDCQGRKVRSLISERQYAGNYSIIWDGKNDAGIPMPSGIYFYHLVSHGSGTQQKTTKKMVYLK
ncbi:MAG TPA: FlgD immunoglobulin-like domain containing protein, partial [Candidatus Marinimicrobia bacterium]|nr:FlgD immunoglobulin-like domain containing protein [Candidatus Neomarinimicrobiota bacterium]